MKDGREAGLAEKAREQLAANEATLAALRAEVSGPFGPFNLPGISNIE